MTDPRWPRSNDPRLNPREQQGQDSCMSVAAPIVITIGLALLKLLRLRPTGESQANTPGSVSPGFGDPVAQPSTAPGSPPSRSSVSPRLGGRSPT